MKQAKKILCTLLAGVLLTSGAIVARAASLDNLFAEGFENTIEKPAFVRSGEGSGVAEADETGIAAVEIPVGEQAGDWVDRNLVAEAWYHIDGTVTDDTQVTIAFWKNGSTVYVYEPQTSRRYNFENAVSPATDTTGWYRIRTASRIMSTDASALTNSKLIISLSGVASGAKLYVDDVKIFETDNLVDMLTHGNSDFDTFDAKCISGWATKGLANGGEVYYAKEYVTSGSYSVCFEKTKTSTNGNAKYGTAGNLSFGLGVGAPIKFYGANVGDKVIVSVNAGTNSPVAASAGWENVGFSAVYKLNSGSTPFQLKDASAATNGSIVQRMSEFQTLSSVDETEFTLKRGMYGSDVATGQMIYFDDISIRIANEGLGVLGLEKYEKEKYYSVDTISNGDTVYPYASFADAQDVVTIVAARYEEVDGAKKLSDIQIKSIENYKENSWFGTWKSSTRDVTDKTPLANRLKIEVPTEGDYTYKIMAWDAPGKLTKILDAVTYEVK